MTSYTAARRGVAGAKPAYSFSKRFDRETRAAGVGPDGEAIAREVQRATQAVKDQRMHTRLVADVRQVVKMLQQTSGTSVQSCVCEHVVDRDDGVWLVAVRDVVCVRWRATGGARRGVLRPLADKRGHLLKDGGAGGEGSDAGAGGADEPAAANVRVVRANVPSIGMRAKRCVGDYCEHVVAAIDADGAVTIGGWFWLEGGQRGGSGSAPRVVQQRPLLSISRDPSTPPPPLSCARRGSEWGCAGVG